MLIRYHYCKSTNNNDNKIVDSNIEADKNDDKIVAPMVSDFNVNNSKSRVIEYKDIKAYHFFHTVGDIFSIYRNIEYENTICWFNAGSLISINKDAHLIHYKEDIIEQLRSIVQNGILQLGIYTQEHIVHPQVLCIIIEIANKYSDIFTHGLAYGGVNSFCGSSSVNSSTSSASAHTSINITNESAKVITTNEYINDGLGGQRYIGRKDSGNFF